MIFMGMLKVINKKINRAKYLKKTGRLLPYINNYFKIRKLIKKSSKMDDRQYVEEMFFLKNGYHLNLDNPSSFNDYIQILKLKWRNDLAKICADKYLVRNYVISLGFEDSLPKLYGVYDSFSQIDFDTLPNSFVVKTNNDSGGVFLVQDKSKLNIKKADKLISKHMKSNGFSNIYKEWVYSGIKKKIIVEEYIKTVDGCAPKDYKFFCFDGEPRFLFVAANRDKNVTFDFFDLEWNHLPVMNEHFNSKQPLLKPSNFDEMVELSRKLSANFPAVRIDLYSENNKIYFGEFTFFHFGGVSSFYPLKYNEIFGKYFEGIMEKYNIK